MTLYRISADYLLHKPHTRRAAMGTKILPSLPDVRNKLFAFIKRDIVFTASAVLAIASCFITTPKIEYIDFKVLACLFNIMIIVKAFEKLRLLEKVSVSILNSCSGSRTVSLVLILLSFFSSMIFTNDVALLTLVPLTIIIGRKSDLDIMPIIIMQTLAANIGSSLTPMGNPQNLYLFSTYDLKALQFFTTVGAFAVTGLIWLLFLNRRNPEAKLEISLDPVKIADKRLAFFWGVIFSVIVLSVFGIVDYKIAFALTAVSALIVDRRLLLKADYPLLLTFICFFIFIGNVSHIPAVNSIMKGLLNSGTSAYFGSIVLSQVISNVPSAILLSGFTSHWRELLLGVNVGGMGTIIASLASVISYKLYIGEKPKNSGKYMLKFSIYNFVSLALFTVINYLLLRLF